MAMIEFEDDRQASAGSLFARLAARGIDWSVTAALAAAVAAVFGRGSLFGANAYLPAAVVVLALCGPFLGWWFMAPWAIVLAVKSSFLGAARDPSGRSWCDRRAHTVVVSDRPGRQAAAAGGGAG